MKNIVTGFTSLILVLVAAGCSAPQAATPAPEPTAAPTQTAAPTLEPTATLEPTPEPTPDVNDVGYIVSQYLVNPNAVFAEDAAAMAENEGGQFGPVDVKAFNSEEGVFEFTTNENNNAWVPLNTLLDEFGENRQKGSPQAILFTFVAPAKPDQLIFDFMGQNEFLVSFKEDLMPGLSWYIEAVEEPFPGDFVIESGKTYNILMAIDQDAGFRSVIWEEGNYPAHAAFADNFSTRQEGDGYKGQTWKFVIGFSKGDTLKILGYEVYTFDSVK